MANNKKFNGNNPYSPLKNPKAFMLHKFHFEQMGIKLPAMDADTLNNKNFAK
jgi:hypothetical protein